MKRLSTLEAMKLLIEASLLFSKNSVEEQIQYRSGIYEVKMSLSFFVIL